MALATGDAIRDRVIALIEGLTPASPPATPLLRRYRNEGGADFVDWAQKNPAAAMRRFQARDDGRDPLPDVSNLDLEDAQLLLIISIAYPQNQRAGSDGALDRDDCARGDWKKINYAIGWAGRANFSSGHDCTPLGCEMRIEQRTGIDLMVIEARFRFYRSTT